MNVRNPFSFYVPCVGIVVFLLFMIGFFVKSFFDFKARGASTEGFVFYCSLFSVIILLLFTFIFNYYYSQMNSRFDEKGVHWQTLVATYFIPWSEMTSVNLFNLRGGEKGLLIVSSKRNFKIELSMVGDREELKRFVEQHSGKRIIGAK